MQRLAALLFVAVLAISLAACGGGSSNSSSSSTPSSVTVSPTSMSLSYKSDGTGDVLGVTPTFSNAAGVTVYPTSITYSSDNTALATVNSSGQVCAGTWDSSDSTVCHAPANGSGGVVTITVKSGSASATLKVYVHPAVNRIEVSGSRGVADCISLGAADKTAIMTARAYSGTVEVTNSVGPFTWSTLDSGVASIDSTGKCTTDNTCVLTASAPGQARVYASLGTISSTGNNNDPATFTTCPVSSIRLHLKDANNTSAALDKSATKTLAFEMVDSRGNSLTTVTPQYSSSQSLVASLASGSTITEPTLTANSPGTATLVASCNPTASCNTNLAPVFSNAFTATVNKASTATATTVFVGSTTGTSLIPVDTSTNTAGTGITLPYAPNSMVMSRDGSMLYLGSSSGLMSVATSSGAVSTNTSAIGKVISASPDGNTELVFDPPISAPGTGTLYVVATVVTTDSSGNSSTSTKVTPYPIANAGSTASAAWTPDSSKAYVVTGSKLVIRSASAMPSTVEVGETTDVDFLAQGSFAYLAGGGADVTVRATCDNSAIRPDIALGGIPAFVRSLPDARTVLALYPNDLTTAVARYLNPITVSTTGAGCPPAVTNTPANAPILLGSFKPGQMVLLPDSSQAFITATDSPTVYSYNVASGNVTPITLTGSGASAALGAGITVDSATLYVGVAGTNDLHVIDTSTNTDTKQISVGFQPDLVAVKPK